MRERLCHWRAKRCVVWALAGVLAVAAGVPGRLLADDVCQDGVAGCARSGTIRVELNRLEPAGDACRPNLVLVNATDFSLADFRLDLVMFDVDGIVADRLAVDASPLLPGKTSLIVFEVPAMPCDGIGRVLINDVIACAGGPEGPGACLGLIDASSRTAAALFK